MNIVNHTHKDSISSVRMQKTNKKELVFGAVAHSHMKIQLLTQLETQLLKVTEAQLREYAAASTLKQQTILCTDEGFVLTFTLSWKQGVFTLFTARSGRPRTFASLDRMLKYLQTQDLLLPEVVIKLSPTNQSNQLLM